MTAATNIAESRVGGTAGGAAEPVLEADTRTRLDRSLSAFGALSLLMTVSVCMLCVLCACVCCLRLRRVCTVFLCCAWGQGSQKVLYTPSQKTWKCLVRSIGATLKCLERATYCHHGLSNCTHTVLTARTHTQPPRHPHSILATQQT